MQFYTLIAIPVLGILTNSIVAIVLNSRIGSLDADVRELRVDIKTLRQEMNEIRTDIKILTGKVYEMMK